MDYFSSRELALSIWLILGIAYLIYSPTFRPHVKKLARCFFSVYIMTPIVGLGLYVAILSYLLIEIGLWDLGQYKNVSLWFVCVGIYSLFKITSINQGQEYLKQTFADLFKLTTLFEFVVTFYSFNFWIELILIPLMTLIMLMSAFSQNKKEHQIVSRLLDKVIISIGLCVITYICHLIILDPSDIFNENTFYDFIVPIALTVGVLPYLYILMTYMEYGRSSQRLRIKLKKKELVTYAKKKSLISFAFRTSELRRWDRYLTFHNIQTKEDINNSITTVKLLIKRNKTAIPVEFECGWSHFEARRYLKNHGLMTSHYDHLYQKKWSASSEPLKLGEGIFSNRITYYIDGSEEAARCLTLVLDVSDVDLFKTDLAKFKEIGNALFDKAISNDKSLNIQIEEKYNIETDNNQAYVTETEGRQIMIQKYSRINSDAFEIRLSFAVDRDSFKYADTI